MKTEDVSSTRPAAHAGGSEAVDRASDESSTYAETTPRRVGVGRVPAIELSVFPHDDEALRVHAEVALQRLGTCDAADLEREIRLAYPSAVVRPRADLATLGVERTWYVYREGSAIARHDPEWWADSGLPTFAIGDDGVYLDANDMAARLLGVSVDAIRGSRIGTFTRHEETDDAGLRAFDTLAATGMLESTAIVVRPDGRDRPVDYHLRRRPEGGYAMVMRERPGPDTA